MKITSIDSEDSITDIILDSAATTDRLKDDSTSTELISDSAATKAAPRQISLN